MGTSQSVPILEPGVFGIDPAAQDQDIKARYHQLSLRHHPDKDPNQIVPENNTDDQSTLQSLLNEAWEVFQDPILHSYYDYVSGYAGNREFYREKFFRLKQLDTDNFIQAALMEEYTGKYADHKLIILEALYGDVVNASTRAVATTPGKTIDVTLTLKKHIVHNRLELQPVDPWRLAPSFHNVPGFYDPNFLDDNFTGDTILYVRYLYRDELYEIYLQDSETLDLPSHEHLVDEIDRCFYSDRTDEHCYSQHPQNENPTMTPALSFVTGALAASTLQIDEDQPTDVAVLTTSSTNENNSSQSQQQQSSASSQLQPQQIFYLPHMDPSVRSKLDSLQQKLADLPLYNRNGVAMPRYTWESKMQPVKRNRRKRLYATLGTLFMGLMSWLQYIGFVNILRWPAIAQQQSQQWLTVLHQHRAKQYQDIHVYE